MPSKALIAPSILSADFVKLGEQIAEVEAAGADWLHIDVMDGHFVPNISMGPIIVEACKRVSKLPLDVHLMIENPDKYIEDFANAGADHITVHVEASPNIQKSVSAIKKLGCKAGVVLKPNTGFKGIDNALPLADIVLVMSVEPGFGGQSFMPEVLPKIQEIRKALDVLGSSALIEIDGGISSETLPLASKAGVDVFVAGSAIFNFPEGIFAGISKLKESANI
jgi:ribulose-phosphate 3-epimerase